jgi:hypothetical protein
MLTVCSAIKGITHLLWNFKVHYRVHSGPPPVLALSQINPAQTYCPQNHFNIMHPSTSRSSEWSLLFRLCKEMFAFLISPMRATRSAHIILLDLIVLIILGEDYKLCNSSLCNLLHPPVSVTETNLKYFHKIDI